MSLITALSVTIQTWAFLERQLNYSSSFGSEINLAMHE